MTNKINRVETRLNIPDDSKLIIYKIQLEERAKLKKKKEIQASMIGERKQDRNKHD